MKLTTLTLATFISLPLFADPNSCEDFISRHYKKDIQSTRLEFTNERFMGEFLFPHQAIKLTIKNTGEMDMNSLTTDVNGYRRMRIRIAGIIRDVRFKIPLDSGQTTIVRTTLPRNTLTRCSLSNVQLDLTHKAGQWGCQVWNNDSKNLRAYLSGRPCFIIRPPLPPIRPVRPVPPNTSN